ncbi:MAG: hypothetical protein K6D38_09530 [Pseudobutyrivibrio sp.]|nr:hypothetical protein [Pseudobutyrivibrio sp.]
MVNDSEIYEVDEKILDLLALDGYVYSEAEKKYKGEDFKKEINDIELLIKVPEEEPRIKANNHFFNNIIFQRGRLDATLI